ncbi:MAG: portal protein [Bacteroidales bacterium]|nr:portal protein [Bacteroidales bacterium]
MLNQKQLSSIRSKASTAKQAWNSEYFEAMAYTQPERNEIWRVKGGFPGNLKQIPLFTQAGKIGVDVFVARIQNKLTPYEKPYFSFRPKDSFVTEYEAELRDLCAQISKRVNERKNELRVDDILNEAYYDLAAGTAAIVRENTINGVQFKKLPITEYMLGTEQHQTVCREIRLAANLVGVYFPELRGMKNIAGRETYGPGSEEEMKLQDTLYFNEQTNRWEYYLQYNDKILLVRDYGKRSPVHLFHWTRASDMPYGTGVAMKAKPALKRLNSYIKCKLELIPFAFPMFLSTAGNFLDRNVNFKPGGRMFVRDIQGVQPIQLSQAKNDFVLEIQSEELAIKQTMLDYTLPNDPREMTAAEVYARQNPQDEMVSIAVSKMTSTIREIGWDLFDDIYARELAGVTSITLDQLHEILECEVNNDAQMDVQAINKILQYIQTVGMFDPQAIYQTLNRGRTLETLEKAYNLPIEITHTAEEIDEAADQAAQQMGAAETANIEAQMAIDNNKEQAKAAAQIAVDKNK